MTRIYRYGLMSDTGWAPCIDDGWISLATCKPSIRASAQPGDWVLGFVPGRLHRGAVIWAGRVSAVVPIGDYEVRHQGRRDAIYRANLDGTFQRLRPDYHPGRDELRKDLSAPVLKFESTASWYFGKSPRQLPDWLMHLAAGGRGHRVNGTLAEDVVGLEAWLDQFPGISNDGPFATSEIDANGCSSCVPDNSLKRQTSRRSAMKSPAEPLVESRRT